MIEWLKRRFHHASSLYQPVVGLLSTGRFFTTFHPGFNRPAQWIPSLDEIPKIPVS